MPTTVRHLARVVALQTLFEIEFSVNTPESILERTLGIKGLAGEPALFAGELVRGVAENRLSLDDRISLYAPAFPVNQLSPIDRNILRIALFEMQVAVKAPPKVVVNEAVELAKEFGAATSPKFINGVLGAAIKDSPKQA